MDTLSTNSSFLALDKKFITQEMLLVKGEKLKHWKIPHKIKKCEEYKNID